MRNTQSDFWWLSEREAGLEWLVGVGHHDPLTDDYEPDLSRPDDNEPSLRDWQHSVSEDGQCSQTFRHYPLSFIEGWRSLCGNSNVYRTLKLFPAQADQDPILGPFLIDIDNQNWSNGYSEDLHDALTAARGVVVALTDTWSLRPERDFRIFFSGRKGFNIEVVPASLGIAGTVPQQIQSSARHLDAIVDGLVGANGTAVDRIYGNHFGYRLKHPYIRLHDSWNSWIAGGVPMRRRRLRITVEDFPRLPLDSILHAAARDP